MISAYRKTDLKQKIKKTGSSIIIFHRSTFSKLVAGIPCSLIFSIKNGEDVWGESKGVFIQRSLSD